MILASKLIWVAGWSCSESRSSSWASHGFCFPLTTSLIVSILISLLRWLFRR